ncbi:MAG: PorT family protein [Prevotellaceae bacterium]|jgi:hypothetical protein|nr:PorT family protein [Prevotellaceae bacterium]
MEKIFISEKRFAKQVILLLLFTLTFISSVIARRATDTVFYSEKNDKKSYIIKEVKMSKIPKYDSDFFVDLGYNRLDKRNLFTGAMHESAVDFPKLRNSASKSFSMYVMFGRRNNNGLLSIMSGLGIDWVNYKFSQDVTIRKIDDVMTQMPISSVLNNFSFMKKSKLTASYLHVPLLLKINFRSFFVAAGVTGGVNIGSHTKIVFNDTHGKKQTYKDYNVNVATFRYGYTVRAGFRHWSLYTNYYVSPLFAKDEGPQVYPFATGLSLNLW